MITRAQIRRQLRKNGGIMNTVPRTGFFLGGIKDRIRKLIPNEIANVASKAAPFVAPFNPGIAAAMRGIGRFDKRGSISDAMKQAALTYGFGKGVGKLGGAEGSELGNVFGRQKYSMEGFKERGLGRLFAEKDTVLTKDQMAKKLKDEDSTKRTPKFMEKLRKLTIDKVPILGNLNPMVQQKLLVGGITAGASALYDFFAEQEPPQEDNETIEQFMERRRVSVGRKMRNYMDNYFKFDSEYSALDDAGRDAFVARYNVAQGGRVGLANGSPHFDPPTFSEGVPQMFMSDELGALPKAEGGVSPEDMGILSIDDFDNVENYRSYIQALAYAMARTEEPNNPRLSEGDIMRMSDRLSNKKAGIRNLAYVMARTEEPDNPRLSEGDIMRQLKGLKNLLGNIKGNVTNDSVGSVGIGRLSEGDVMRILDRITNKKAQGGRIKKYGGGVTAAMPKIPTGTPRVNAGGISELDYRAKGGFVPVGVKEKADDVPAMLSKNEFVMTADAVKGAGGGNVEKGAQKMYNTMKRLEGRVA